MSSKPPSVPSIVVAPDAQGDIVHEYVAGELIQDKYQLTKPLGRGGMGSVWQAHNLALDSEVAIKIILNDGRQAQLADRLLREARASARLNHPGIVRVFDVGTTPYRDAYLVMELLKGASLADQLATTGRLAAIRAVQLFLPLAAALEHAHKSGIIHRDLKPDNIFLAETQGQVIPKVLDFGVAMDLNLDAHRITQAGTLLGSPAYMSPEQARGDVNLDRGTDIWSFCVSLYEALTLETPFGDDGNYYVLLDRIVKAPPTPTTDHVAGDDALWQIIERGLQKHADDRWPSMQSLGVALATWLEGHDIAEDILGQGLQSTWLAPDSGNPRVSLHDAPPNSARISGSLRRSSDHPSGRPTAHPSPISSRPPGERISSAGHTTLASTLHPSKPPPAGRGRWLLPAGVAVAVACGAAAWGLGASNREAHDETAGSAHAAGSALGSPAQKSDQLASPAASASTSATTAAVADPDVPAGKASGAQSSTPPSPPTEAEQAPALRRKAEPPRAPSKAEASPAPPQDPPPPTPKPSKPKLGDDLGF